MLRSISTLLRLALLPALIVVLWWAVAHSGSVAEVLLPAPERVLRTAFEMASDGTLAGHIAISAQRVLTGFALATAVGVGLGLTLSRAPRLRESLQWSIDALRMTPPLALIPLLILWLGIEEAPKVAVVFLSGFFPIYLNTLTAFASVDPKLVELAKSLHFSRKEMFTLLLWPAALPGIVTGLRLGFGYCWRALVGAELIAAASGLGFMISESGEFLKTDCVFVGIFTIVVLGIAADALLKRLLWLGRARRHARGV